MGGNVTLQGNAIVKANEAVASGGGIYVADGGTFTMTGGTVGGTTAEGNKATGENGAGGGLFMAGGTATISDGSISGNSATKDGGGVYMYGESASCTLSNNAKIGGESEGYGNTAQYGGGINAAGGTITVRGGRIAYNTATMDGGGIYSSGPNSVVNVERQDAKATALSCIERNTAQNGGGIYANIGTVNFSDGHIQYNHATEAGGGIYVNDNGGEEYGRLFLTGNANLYRNNVPEGHDGGGVYLKGVVTVGQPGATGRIMAQENFAGDGYVYEWADTGHPETDSIDQVTANNRNNIYLPVPAVDATRHTGVITVIEGGISTDSHVGFSVPHGNVPVIYCAYSPTSRGYLHQFSTGHAYQYNLFDDSRHYIAVQYSNQPEIFDPDHVYLFGFWSNIVTGSESDEYCYVNPSTFDPMDIDEPCELAFFISYVNGLNGQAGDLTASARLTADIDMSDFGWVPIGRGDGYSGTFDGNGHTVSGLVGLLYREYTDYGFFGRLADGAEVKDLYVKGANFYLEENDNALAVGGLAGEMDGNAVVRNTEVSSVIYAENPNTVVGGLVGRMGHTGTATPAIHSAIAIPNLTGYTMGGLVGQLEKGDLLNSFTQARFHSQADTTHYQGGLAAVNRGRIENCYYHELTGSTHGTLFGTLAGDNTGGTVNYCYAGSQKGAPYGAPTAPYAKAGDNPKGHGYFADNTVTPYYYRRRDNQVTLEVAGSNRYIPADYVAGVDNPDLIASGVGPDKQMLLCLNNWVDENSGTTTYTKWARPTTKVINDDLPLLLMPTANAVAATTGDPYLEYGSVNSRIERFTRIQQAIYMYRSQADTVVSNMGDSPSDAPLYIDEHVALIQEDGELKAYVGVTLDNSAGRNGAQPTFGVTAGTPATDYTDWHMFATPLYEMPLGIEYADDDTQWHGEDFEYDYYAHPVGMPYYRFKTADDEGGYFPSMTYQYAVANGFAWDGNDSTEDQYGNYYKEWDFYCYYEPEYHWINFKRNSNDHWHENAHDAQIEYENEEYLELGKGYLVATREDNTFLQAQGILNYVDLEYPVTRSGAFSPGYNLLGNPYQAYLDFELFANDNALLWDTATPSYYVIDEDRRGYVAYASQGSSNPARPGQLIHPHQGFMILLKSGEGGKARFSTAMRNTQGTEGFRSSQPAYPLVNLTATEQNGNGTMVTVELGRPDKGGAAVLRDMHVSRGKLYCRYEGEDYEIAFTRPGLTEAAIRFETLEDAEYTMTWDTHNGEFSYLHLIDNLTGADVDCLAESEYRFASKTTDYKSRFRLVFGYTGIDEPEAPEPSEGTASFAFQMGDQLVVNGEGTLQLFDMGGRQVMATETVGTQTAISLPKMAAGVYTMRLTTDRSSQVQKVVIR